MSAALSSRRPPKPRIFGVYQSRADICARQALDLTNFTRFASVVVGDRAPPFKDIEPLSAEVALALLTIATDTLSWRLTESVAFGLFHVAFALRLVAWPEELFSLAAEPEKPASSLAGQRLARLIAAELRAERLHSPERDAESAPTANPPAPISTAMEADGEAPSLLVQAPANALPAALPSPQRLLCTSFAVHPALRPHRICLRCHCRVAAFGPAPLCPSCECTPSHSNRHSNRSFHHPDPGPSLRRSPRPSP
jgi:hypothetical protein